MEINAKRTPVFFHLKRTFPKWLLVAVIACVVIVALHFIALSIAGTCSASILFSYDGIESGLTPDGNRFDLFDLKNEEVVRNAAQAVGRELTDEDAQAIQLALEVQGTLPISALESIIERTSIFDEDEQAVKESSVVRDTSYFPSRYKVTFHYADAGFKANEGMRYLEALLEAYKRYFFSRYGYNASLERSVEAIDYEEYDYINSVDVLNDRLLSLRAYLAHLAAQDNTRFVSKQTGHSFSDLVEAVDILRSEDVNWITSYIVSNNMTKDRDNLIDYYRYRIRDAEREMTQETSRLATLNELIEGYVKTDAILAGVLVGDGALESGTPANYEFSQKSEMYDSLINSKISCQTAISETQERIALLESRMERLQNNASGGNPELLEASLKSIEVKVRQFLEDTNQTATEFFEDVWFQSSIQTQEPFRTEFQLSSLLRSALLDVLIVEGTLFGLYCLLLLKRAYAPEKAASGTPGAEERKEAAPI